MPDPARRPRRPPPLATIAVRLLPYLVLAWGTFAVMGAHQERDSTLHITPGTGCRGIPVRLGAAPEITPVTLRRAAAAAATVQQARAVGRRPALARA